MKQSNLLAVYLDRPLDKLEDKYGSETFNEWLCGGGNLERVYYVFELAEQVDTKLVPLSDMPLSVFLYNVIEVGVSALFERKMLENQKPPTAIELANWINTDIKKWGSKDD
jgi:hypothetical protein